VIDLLKSLQRQFNMAVLLITHRSCTKVR
jgi:ABC-type microcin C transport system duplicated ATPase subunit YejF